jgi:hypothetical protein
MNKITYKKAGILSAMLVCFTVAILLFTNITLKTAEKTNENNDINSIIEEDNGEWHLRETVNSKGEIWKALGTDAGSCWDSAFHLDYAQTPSTYLVDNSTDFSSDPNCDGFVSSDNQETDLASENGAYICFRCHFDDTAKDGASWDWERFKVSLTVTGDESISREEMVNSSNDGSNTGDAVVQTTGGIGTDYIYIVFYWDDNSDGYRITDDGSLDWSISIYEKY